MTIVGIVHLCRGREWRGGERQVRLLARMLARRDDLPQLVATRRQSHLARALRDDGQPVLELSWSAAHDPRAWLGVVRRLRELRRAGTPLVLHAHDSHALTLGLFASRLLTVPLVATRRSAAPAGWQWRHPARVIAISHAVEQALIASGVSQARVTRIPSAIELAGVRQIPAAGQAVEPFVVAVGALTPEKGHATLIDAFAHVVRTRPSLRLRLLGDGPERETLIARAARLGISSRVELMGEVADPADWMAGAELLIQPSYREALGTAVLEAMALGIPVVASRTGGLTELLDGGAGLLVPPHDVAALAEGIAALLDAPDRRANLVRAARARVMEFDAPGMADRVVEVYRSALGDT